MLKSSERRQAARKTRDLHVLVRQEGNEGFERVTLENLSRLGFLLSGESRLEPGSRIRIHPWGWGKGIPARVHWMRQVGARRFISGCEFLDPRDVRELEEARDRGEILAGEHFARSLPTWVIGIFLAAAAAFILWFVATQFLMLR